MSNILRLTLKGTAALLMHNARLSDPLDPIAREMKAISGKRKKTDADHEQLAHLDFIGGLYFEEPDRGRGPILPGENVQAALITAGKITREGALLTRGILMVEDAPLIYTGPRDVEGLWANQNFRHRKSVKIGMNRVFRTRPMFQEWAAEVSVLFDSSTIEGRDLVRIAETAGTQVGLGDWRPRFGRFEIIGVEEA